jgi:hypothetical protein
MYPIDCLTKEDKETINEYLKYNGIYLENLNNVLNNWNKNKTTLFKAFGKKLRLSIPIETKVRGDYLKQQLREYYTYPNNVFSITSDGFSEFDILKMLRQDSDNIIKEYKITNDFILDTFLFFIDEKRNIDPKNYKHFLLLLNYNDVYRNVFFYSAHPVFFIQEEKNTLTIKNGIKTMRAIRKVLDYFDYPNMHLFEEWRDKISSIRTTTTTITNLTFSIHPLDFMTLSNNNSNWGSCLSWVKSGCYSNGTLELLNSNIAVVCYIENPNTDYYIFNEYKIPNKMWRTLAYVHKKIIVIGKNYPFFDENISKQCLQFLEKIVKKNLKWTYKYKNQEYKDMVSFENDPEINHGSMEEIKYIYDSHSKTWGGKHIFLGGNNIYNDICADPTTKYLCSRNWVRENLFLNISGPCTCLTCGNEILDYGPQKICPECEREYKCPSCKHISTIGKNYHVKIFSPRTYFYSFDKDYLDISQKINFKTVTFCEECLRDRVKRGKLSIFNFKNVEILYLDDPVSPNTWVAGYLPALFYYLYKYFVLHRISSDSNQDVHNDMLKFYNEHSTMLNWEDIENYSEWIWTN